MLPHGSSLLGRTIAGLILSVSAVQSASAQAPSTPGIPENLLQDSPIVPESTIQRGPLTSPSGGLSTTQPVMTPGYFEVVCPAMCYGGAFHVCGVRGFGGPGYYGPLRRYWAYSTYGPNFNIGPDNSLQYGLYGGVIYQAMRHGHGQCKHGTNPCPNAGYVPMVQRKTSGWPPPIGGSASTQPAAPPRPPQPEKLPPPPDKSARLRIRVPANAEVLVEGRKTTTTGTVREFVSPPLDPGKNMIYSVVVRYTDARGKEIQETHSIRVRANAQFDLDCTKPANAEPSRATVQRP